MKFFNRFRIIIAISLFPFVFYLWFYLLSLFLHNSLIHILILSVIALLGFWLNKRLENLAKKQLENLNKIFIEYQFPKPIISIRNYGGELFFPLVLLSIGADPIGDLVKLQPISYQINYIFSDIALFILVISFIPSFVWILFKELKESIKNYW